MNRNALDFNVLTDFSHLSRTQHSHLKDVYKNLTLLLLVSALGCYTQIYVKAIPHIVSVLGAIATMLYVKVFNPYQQEKQNDNNRLLAFAAFGFFEGAAVGNLVGAVLEIDPNIVLYAFVGTCAIFLSFSLVALFADQRQYLFLGGVLMSAINAMLFMSFLNIFIRSAAVPWLELYGGLIVFSLYVIYDTQMILAKAESPAHRDSLGNAIELFIDFVAIFVRLLIILTKNSDKKKKKNNDN